MNCVVENTCEILKRKKKWGRNEGQGKREGGKEEQEMEN